jgi:hypothetical protein
MSRRRVELPNIEDATLRACLAPLAEAIAASPETVTPFPREPVRPPPDRQPWLERQVPSDRSPRVDWSSLPRRQPDPIAWSDTLPPPPVAPRGPVRSPETLVEWQALAAQEFGVFGTVQQLLERTDTQLTTAALEYPQQIDGTLARLELLEERLVQQCCAVTTLLERLNMAVTQAMDIEAGLRSADRAKHRSNPGR